MAGGKQEPPVRPARAPVRLKDVAESVGLSSAAVSYVLNRSPAADSIPQETRDRILAAARELDYRPDFVARSLRTRRTFSVGVLVPEVSEGYAAGIMHGVEEHLMDAGYFYLLASHRSDPRRLAECIALFEERLVEGLILIAAGISETPRVPTVVISGHRRVPEVTNVVLDENRAAELALGHLTELGHERIALFRGPEQNADAEFRWRAIKRAAKALGLEENPELERQTSGVSYGEAFYQEGYVQARSLLDAGARFTALFAFNDISAIGAMRALFDAGLRVPQDVSVVGFDDIESASYIQPSLTTVRQPLRVMGERAGEVLLARLAGGELPAEVVIGPELVARSSTGPKAGGRRDR